MGALAASLVSCGLAAGGAVNRPDPPVQAPARDPDIAVREEFEHAERVATAEAWQLFLARHPDHALAAIAKDKLAALEAMQRLKD